MTSADLYLVANDWRASPAVTIVEMESSSGARSQALAVASGAQRALSNKAVLCTERSGTPTSALAFQYRWLAAQNVALLVRTRDRPTAADKAFLASLASNLERAATPGD